MKKMNKQERILLSGVRRHFRKIAANARSFIRKGIGDLASSGSCWSLSDKTFLHVVIDREELTVRAVVNDFVVSEVKRKARRPGIREADLKAIAKMEKEGPGLVVESFLESLDEILKCGDQIGKVGAVVRSKLTKPRK